MIDLGGQPLAWRKHAQVCLNHCCGRSVTLLSFEEATKGRGWPPVKSGLGRKLGCSFQDSPHKRSKKCRNRETEQDLQRFLATQWRHARIWRHGVTRDIPGNPHQYWIGPQGFEPRYADPESALSARKRTSPPWSKAIILEMGAGCGG